MKSRFFSFLMIMVPIFTVNYRPMSMAMAMAPNCRPGTQGECPPLDQLPMDMEQQGGREGEKRIGSNPPSCEHKCYGCSPCEATQVPAMGVAIQDSNYEPEGWKCKCGRSFYSP